MLHVEAEWESDQEKFANTFGVVFLASVSASLLPPCVTVHYLRFFGVKFNRRLLADR